MKRVLHEIRATAPGPTLVGLGGMHGNEPAGLEALDQVGRELVASGILRGEFVALAGNLPALAAGVRFVDRDLNRIWDAEEGERGREERELGELRAAFAQVRERARGPVYLVDLHTTSGDGPPFTILGDTLANRGMALSLPVPMVLGLADALPGTLVDSLDTVGVASLAFEAGRHDDPESIQRSADALRVLLAWLGMVVGGRDQVRDSRVRLARTSRGHPSALRLTHRHALEADRDFRMQMGLRSFERVRRGDLLAREGDAQVRAPASGHILLPLYQTKGEDGFFMGRAISRSWLRVSETLRRRRVDRLLRFLPGIIPERDVVPGQGVAFRVHPLIRRIFFPSLFRLLGYRAIPCADGRYLLVRRPEPTELTAVEERDTPMAPAGREG
jgi:predicted deacylase